MSQSVSTNAPEVKDGTTPEKVEQTTGANTGGTPEKTFTQTEVDALIKERLGRETKKYADYDAVKGELKRLKETGQTTEDTLRQQITELSDKMTAAEARATANLIKSSVVAAAARLDFNDPADAYRLLDLQALEVTDDGVVKGLEQALQKLLADKPYLRKQAGTKTSATNPAGASTLTLEQIKRMSPAEINARWDDVQKVIGGN